MSGIQSKVTILGRVPAGGKKVTVHSKKQKNGDIQGYSFCSKCGSQTSRISVTWELVRNAERLKPNLSSTESESAF